MGLVKASLIVSSDTKILGDVAQSRAQQEDATWTLDRR